MAAESFWLSIAGAVVSATAALSGVVITQRATRRREHMARVWGKRADTYVKLMLWLVSTEDRLAIMAPKTGLRADQATELLPANEVVAEVAAYASKQVEREFEVCVGILHVWADPPDSDMPMLEDMSQHSTAEASEGLADAIKRLRDSVRRELTTRPT